MVASSIRFNSTREQVSFVLLAGLFIAIVWSLHASARTFQAHSPQHPSTSATLAEPIESPTPCCTEKPHHLFSTYYTVNSGLTAKLLLNNKGPNELVAQPALIASSGEVFNAPAVTVQGKSFQLIDLHQWIDLAGPQFREGSIEIFHVGEDLVLGAQLYLENERESLSFDEKLVELGSFKSSQMEGLWWLPTQKGEVEIALANTSVAPLTVSISANGQSPHRSGQLSLELAPRETRLLSVTRDIMHREHGAMSRYGGISIHQSGSPGDLLARGFAQDEQVGYSLPIQFSDPAAAKSSELQGVGLRLGSAGSDLLNPLVVLRNISTEPTVVTGRLPYTQEDGTRNSISLPDVRLSAGESAVLDISRVMHQQNCPWFNGVGGLEFKYSTAPGTILITAMSVSDSGNQVFRVPMWDVAAQRSPTGGYPWRIDGNSSTTVYIKNASETQQKYFVQVNYEGGSYFIGMKTLSGGETVSYDLRKIRDEQVPDSRGRVIPLNVSSGQVHWSANGDGMMIGRSEQADLVKGISSNYACMNCCGDIPYIDSQQVTPNSATVTTEQSFLFTAEEQYLDCYGNYSDFVFIYDGEWSSNNVNVASADGPSGNVTGVGPGTATITASWSEYIYHYNPVLGSCVPHQNNYSKTATITVKPHIDNIDPPRGLVGSTVRIRINGAGLADSSGSASVQGDSEVSVNNVDGFSANETQISANLTIASSATAGNHTLTVTVSGQSATVNFFVQIPKALVRADFFQGASPNQESKGFGPIVTVNDGGNVIGLDGAILNGLTNKCGAYRNLLYYLMDQDQSPHVIQASVIVDEAFPENEKTGDNIPSLIGSASTTSEGYLQDVNGLIAEAGSCANAPSISGTEKQHFSVTISGYKYDLSTVITISLAYNPNATPKYTISNVISTP